MAASHAFPGHPFAVIGYAKVLVARGDRTGALTLLQNLQRTAPTPDLAARIGDLYKQLGRDADAEREYALAEAGWRVDAPEPKNLARFLADHDRKIDEAVAIAEKAAADRHDIFTNDALAWAYYKAGRVDDARARHRAGAADRHQGRRHPGARGGHPRRAPGRVQMTRALLVWRCCAALWSAARRTAHEIGTSQASAVFRGAEFQIDVVVDPDTLLSKLEAFGGRPVSHGLSRAERDSRIRELADVFLAETGVQFDGDSVRPRFEYLPVVGLQRSGAVALGRATDRPRSRRAPALRLPLRPGAGHLCAQRADRRRSGRDALDRRRRHERARSRWPRAASPLTRARRGAAVPDARLHAHRAPRSRSHPVRARHLPAHVALAIGRGAGQHVHARALDHAGA